MEYRILTHNMLFQTSSNNNVTVYSGCPDGKDKVNCFVNPCQFASCPAFPTATCEADFCGGCNARFFLSGREVTNKCGKCSAQYIRCDSLYFR